MKRFILLLLAFVLLVPTAACGASAAPQSTGDSFAPQAQTTTAEAVASASPRTLALPDTLSDEEKEDLIAAYELGIAPESFLSTLEKPITQFDATMLIRNANDLYFGANHSKYLEDVANHIAEKEQVASRYWIAQNIFYAHCEDVFDAPYTDAKTWAEYCGQQGVSHRNSFRTPLTQPSVRTAHLEICRVGPAFPIATFVGRMGIRESMGIFTTLETPASRTMPF